VARVRHRERTRQQRHHRDCVKKHTGDPKDIRLSHGS
jgi:hypothetical protein